MAGRANSSLLLLKRLGDRRRRGQLAKDDATLVRARAESVAALGSAARAFFDEACFIEKQS
jgi:hypothetical protein